MNPRERVLSAFNHEEPDRVPIDFGGPMSTVELQGYQKLLDYLKIEEYPKVFNRMHVAPSEEVLTSFNADCRYIYFNEKEEWQPNKHTDNRYIGEWGITWYKPETSYYFDPVSHPLEGASLGDLEEFDWPTEIEEEDKKRWREQAKRIDEHTNYAIGGDVQGLGVFEQSFNLRGFAQFLKDMGSNKEFANGLLDKVVETQKKRLAPYIDAIDPYVDFLVFSDDLAMQDNLLMSPDMYRELIKPRHRDLYSFVKNKTDAKIFHHSCGAIKPLLEDLIDVGIDILNPIQVSAKWMNDTTKLKKEFGDRLVFWGGGCNTQNVLTIKPPSDVKREVKRRVQDLSPGGGYIFCAVHNIQPDVPPENIVTLYDSAIKYGDYQN